MDNHVQYSKIMHWLMTVTQIVINVDRAGMINTKYHSTLLNSIHVKKVINMSHTARV